MKKIQRMCFAFVVCCGMFAQAQVTGSGTTNYLPVWTGSSTLGNSHIYQGGSNVGVNTQSPQYSLDVGGHINSSEGYLIGGSLVLTTPGGPNYGNTVVGYEAMPNNTGVANTAAGAQALQFNTVGEDDTAVGAAAMSSASGSESTAVGAYALMSGTESGNTAVGYEAGATLGAGAYNTLLGNYAGTYPGFPIGLFGGSYNVAIGSLAGSNLYNGNYNIEISNAGASSDSGVVRIGTGGQQTSFFAAGIRGVTTGENNAVMVVIDGNGQLGTVSSSRRFKTDIQDMGEASHGLLRLRPVTFRYRKPYADGSQPVQYGLIAEEVAEVYPDLVAYGNDGQPESVKYQVLDSMLLNEVQRQQVEIQDLRERLMRVEATLNSASPAATVRAAKELNSEITGTKGEQ
jgi:hypothetical protein